MCKKPRNRVVKRKRKYNFLKKNNFWKVIPRDSCEVYRERLKRRLEENCSEKGDFKDAESKTVNNNEKNKSKKSKVKDSRRRRRRRCSWSESTTCSSFSQSSTNTTDMSEVSKMDTD